MKKYSFIYFVILSIFFSACSDSKEISNTPTSEDDYSLENIFEHNISYFTQGFEFSGDTLIEGTGQYEQSKLVKYNVTTGQIYKSINIGDEFFGEGITVLNSKIYQLTWKSELCFVYNYDDLQPIGTLSYDGEGWGLTNNDTLLIMSNGSSTIFFRDPSTFEILRQISVKDSNNMSYSNLNELEFVDEKIYANIWGSDYILIIDPQSGLIERKIYLSELRSMGENYISSTFVLNGIALHPNGNIFVTGKNWPNTFEISIK